ncbi:MAG: hypothetical protein U1F63_15130 [Chitinivorax sp.]
MTQKQDKQQAIGKKSVAIIVAVFTVFAIFAALVTWLLPAH